MTDRGNYFFLTAAIYTDKSLYGERLYLFLRPIESNEPNAAVVDDTVSAPRQGNTAVAAITG